LDPHVAVAIESLDTSKPTTGRQPLKTQDSFRRNWTHSLRPERTLMRTWVWLLTAVCRRDRGPLAISHSSCKKHVS